jgi:EAL domain-containing protein (putative c-di-GMP-specific phosphodiesterase class I)
MPAPLVSPHRVWLLECLMGGPRRQWRVPISGDTFRIGRQWGLDLILNADSVSKLHAEIYRDGSGLRVRDLGSTNGCLVNQERIDDAPLHEGDLLAFADVEFRLIQRDRNATESSGTAPIDRDGARKLVERCRQMEQLLDAGAVSAVFQPIVSMRDSSIVAYEALGRGAMDGLPDDPASLFALAANLGREAELSSLLRRRGADAAAGLPGPQPIFVNSHPAETDVAALAGSLSEIQKTLGERRLVLEVHEWAIGNLAMMGELKSRLRDLDVGLAYDDFGAGHARLLELGEVPPDFLKFDICFIHAIDQAPPSRARLLRSLVGAAQDLGVKTIAEGVETQVEASICAELGFDAAQGYLFHPALPAGENA